MTKSKNYDVHASSIIDAGAQIGDGVQIGPFCHVGPKVKLGTGVQLLGHVSVHGDTTWQWERIGGIQIYGFYSCLLRPGVSPKH